jgi:beta-lactamase regulating signal transducer with metallopeptidase domain
MSHWRARVSPFSLALGLAIPLLGLEALGTLSWLGLLGQPSGCAPFCELRCTLEAGGWNLLAEAWLVLWAAAGFVLVTAALLALFYSGRIVWTTKKALGMLRASPANLEGFIGVSVFENTSVPLAFTAGFLSPKVYASKALICKVSPKELSLVLAHELHHVKKKDPLKVLILSSLAFAFPLCPLFARLHARFLEEAEIMADDAALKAVDDPRLLARTLLNLSAQATTMFAAFFSQGPEASIVATRVKRLVGAKESAPSGWPSFSALFPSLLFYGFFILDPAFVLAGRLHGGAYMFGCLCSLGLS